MKKPWHSIFGCERRAERERVELLTSEENRDSQLLVQFMCAAITGLCSHGVMDVGVIADTSRKIAESCLDVYIKKEYSDELQSDEGGS
jgi:hypothetical protein